MTFHILYQLIINEFNTTGYSLCLSHCFVLIIFLNKNVQNNNLNRRAIGVNNQMKSSNCGETCTKKKLCNTASFAKNVKPRFSETTETGKCNNSRINDSSQTTGVTAKKAYNNKINKYYSLFEEAGISNEFFMPLSFESFGYLYYKSKAFIDNIIETVAEREDKNLSILKYYFGKKISSMLKLCNVQIITEHFNPFQSQQESLTQLIEFEDYI